MTATLERGAARYADLPMDMAHGSHGKVIELIGTSKRVCELGPATGYMSEAIAAAGNELVAGIEIDPEAAQVAQRWFRALYVRDLDRLDEQARLPIHSIDVIVASDVLEHLMYPVPALKHMRDWLAPGGNIVASIPNVAHGSIRLALLSGRWNYVAAGLMDHTHVRWYTRDTIGQMFAAAGFRITEMHRITIPIEVSEVPWPRGEAVFQRLANTLSQEPDATTYQYVVRAEMVPLA